MSLSWFLDTSVGTGQIVVKKELFDDKSAFFLGGAASEITDAAGLGDFPFLTEVQVFQNEPVYTFMEDVVIYNYDPLYKGADTPTTVRFRGLTTGYVYTFFGIDVNKPIIHEMLDKRTATDDAVFRASAEPDEAGQLGKCVGTTLGIIIYDKDYNIINPLTITNEPSIFVKPDGPGSQSEKIQRSNNGNGPVSLSQVPYFLNVEQIPLFAGITFPAPKSVPLQTEQAMTADSKTQKRKSTADSSTSQVKQASQEDTGHTDPKTRISNRNRS